MRLMLILRGSCIYFARKLLFVESMLEVALSDFQFCNLLRILTIPAAKQEYEVDPNDITT